MREYQTFRIEILPMDTYNEFHILSIGIKGFKDLDKPLHLTVCKNDQFIYTRADELGYPTHSFFLNGERGVNSSQFNWNGNLTGSFHNETLGFLYDSGLDKVSFDQAGNVSEHFLIPHGPCKQFLGKLNQKVNIIFSDKEGVYNVYVSDPGAGTAFQLPHSLISGDKMQITLTSVQKATNYHVYLREAVDELYDGSCVDYPYAAHISYSECVEAEMRGLMLESLGCSVPWISKENDCTGPVQRLPRQVKV